MNRRLTTLIFIFSLALFVSACGRDRAAEPTALPPDVARPDQPTPVFDNSARVFRLTPPPTIPANGAYAAAGQGLASFKTPAASASDSQERALLRSVLAGQPPTALGIVRSQTTLRVEPGGEVIERLFAGETVTITGRSPDGRHLAAFTATGAPGWLPSAGVTLYGADDLTVVEQSVGPGPVATRIAEAMTPEGTSVLDAVMTAMP